MYYPHPLLARQMRQFPILRLPWRRYQTAGDPATKAFAKRQYRKAERAYRLMADAYKPAKRPGVLCSIRQFVHAIWGAFISSF